MRSVVLSSATRTLEALAKGFGVGKVGIDFKDSDLIQVRVDYEPKPDEAAA